MGYIPLIKSYKMNAVPYIKKVVKSSMDGSVAVSMKVQIYLFIYLQMNDTLKKVASFGCIGLDLDLLLILNLLTLINVTFLKVILFFVVVVVFLVEIDF